MNTFVVAFATSEWQLYIGLLFAMASMALSTLCRSIISKLVDAQEIGSIFAITGFFQVWKLLVLQM